MTPQTIYAAVASEQLIFAEALKNPEATQWGDLAKRTLFEKIMNMPDEGIESRITTYADITMYFQAVDNAGKHIFSTPPVFPDEVAQVFATQTAGQNPKAHFAYRLPQEGHIWVTVPVADAQGRVQGHVDLLLVATFNAGHILLTANGVWEGVALVLILFSSIGLLGGLVAAYFVTGRLKRIDAVTAVWREGDFSPRISLAASKCRDVFAKHSQRLNAMADDLEALFTLRQKVAVIEERNRVARELHDTVKQNLFALKLQLAAGKYKNGTIEATGHFEEAERITHEAQREITEILTHLSSEQYAECSFYDRMAALAGDMRRRFDLEVVWDKKEAIIATPEQEHTLVRLAQEAMNNAVRHGKASKVTMQLYGRGTTNYWTITDNGCGFSQKTSPPAEDSSPNGGSPSGSGIVFMRERAASLPEGAVAIENSKEGGVTVAIQWSML